MANYKVTNLAVNPVYPTGATKFLPSDEVIIRVTGKAQRDKSDPSWFAWNTVIFAYKADGTLIARHDQVWRGSPPSLIQDFNQQLNLGKWLAGTLSGYVTVQCYG